MNCYKKPLPLEQQETLNILEKYLGDFSHEFKKLMEHDGLSDQEMVYLAQTGQAFQFMRNCDSGCKTP